MDYKKKSLKNLNTNGSYEEIDTRLASGWYVDNVSGDKKKKYKTKEVSYKIAKKSRWFYYICVGIILKNKNSQITSN